MQTIISCACNFNKKNALHLASAYNNTLHVEPSWCPKITISMLLPCNLLRLNFLWESTGDDQIDQRPSVKTTQCHQITDLVLLSPDIMDLDPTKMS